MKQRILIWAGLVAAFLSVLSSCNIVFGDQNISTEIVNEEIETNTSIDVDYIKNDYAYAESVSEVTYDDSFLPYVSDYNDRTGTFTVQGMDTTEFEHTAGDILLAEPTEQIRSGLMNKIVAVAETDSGVEVTTVPATAAEVFDELDIHFEKALEAADYETATLGPRVQFLGPDPGKLGPAATLEVDDINYQYFEAAELSFGDGVTLSGRVGVDLSLEVLIKANSSGIDTARFKIDGNQLSELELGIQASAKFQRDRTTPDLFVLDIPLGNPFVYLTLHFKLGGGILLDANAGLSSSITQSGDILVGMEYNEGSYTSINEATNEFEVVPPTETLELGAKVWAGPRLSFGINRAEGPYFHIRPYASYRISNKHPYGWTVDVGADTQMGVDFKLWGFGSLSHNFGVLTLVAPYTLNHGQMEAPSDLAANPLYDGAGIDLNWATPRVAGSYEIERKGPNDAAFGRIMTITDTTRTTFKDENVLPDSTYSYRIAAIANYEDETYRSSFRDFPSVTVPADNPDNGDNTNTPPESSILTGPDQSTQVGGVTLSWTGSDAETASSELQYEYYLDPYESEWTHRGAETSQAYTDLPVGDFTFYVRAVDGDGGVDQSPATRSFTLVAPATNDPPDTSILDGPQGSVTESDLSFSWSGTDDNTAPGSLRFEYYLEPIESNWSSSSDTTQQTYPSMTAGSYVFHVRAIDEEGQPDPTPATRSFTVSDPSDPTQPGSVVIDARFDLKVANYEEQGLFAWRLKRNSDGENGLPSEAVYIAARPKHDQLQLRYMDNGSQFAIDSADTQLFSSYSWVNVRVLDDGSSIRVLLDDTEVLNETFDSSSVGGSYIGFMARESNYGGGNTYVDNVEVTFPSGDSENENFDTGVGSWTVVEGNSTVTNGELNILSTSGNRGMVSFPMEAVSQPIGAAYVFSDSASQSFNRTVTDVTSLSALSGPTKDFAAAWYGDRAYIFGGASGPGAYNTTYAYDPASDSYASGTNLPANRRWLEAVTVESEIFVVGGSPDPSASDQAWSYSPASDSFTSIASMNTARSNFALAEVNEDLYAFGGESNGLRRNSAEMYDASADSWSSISNLPSNRYLKYVGAVSHGGYVYLFGGNGGATSTSGTNYAQVYRYDPVADSYSTMTSMPVAAGAPLCIPDGDSVLVVIGDTVYRYDITADSWSTEGTLDSSVSGRGAAVAGW